jgi:hypothetical protein
LSRPQVFFIFVEVVFCFPYCSLNSLTSVFQRRLGIEEEHSTNKRYKLDTDLCVQMLLEMPAAADHERHTTHFFEAPEKVVLEPLATPDALALHTLFLSTSLMSVKVAFVFLTLQLKQPHLCADARGDVRGG